MGEKTDKKTSFSDEPRAVVAEDKIAVEVLAEQAGLLPQTFPGRPAQLSAGTLIPGTAPRPNPQYWKFAAAKALYGWVEGAEMTKAQFDAAVKAAETNQIA